MDRVRKVIPGRKVCSSPSMGKEQCREGLVTTWTGRGAMDVPGIGRCGHAGGLPGTWGRAVKGVGWLSQVAPWAGKVPWVKDASTTYHPQVPKTQDYIVVGRCREATHCWSLKESCPLPLVNKNLCKSITSSPITPAGQWEWLIPAHPQELCSSHRTPGPQMLQRHTFWSS